MNNWTGKHRVVNTEGKFLVNIVPGFPKEGQEPEWTDIPECGFGFSFPHAQDQIGLLYWDYKQHAKVITKEQFQKLR